MENDKILILRDIYFNFLEEKRDAEQKLDRNLTRISQIDTYLKSIYEKEEEDFKVFSPRDVKLIYKDEIQRSIDEKNEIENDNQSHYEKINKLSWTVNHLKSILDELEEENNKIKIDEDEGNKLDKVSKSELLEEESKEGEEEFMQQDLSLISLNYQMQEKERQRIARELHDSSLQNLTHLIHKIELSSMFIEQDPVRAKIELATINKCLKGIIEDIRNTIFDLRPMSFDDLGLKDTLERLFANLKESSNIEIEYDIDDIQYKDQIISMNIFRMIQECCSNAVKHSKATLIKVVLKNDINHIDIQIIDNGIGFDTHNEKKNHFGLSIIRERVSLLEGNIDIQSILNMGTTIHILLPISIKL